MELTPLEEAVISAHEVACGLAGLALIKDLLDKGDAANIITRDRERSLEDRKQALVESRHVNQVLNLIAAQRSLAFGIDA
jgi:hypothetical protein